MTVSVAAVIKFFELLRNYNFLAFHSLMPLKLYKHPYHPYIFSIPTWMQWRKWNHLLMRLLNVSATNWMQALICYPGAKLRIQLEAQLCSINSKRINKSQVILLLLFPVTPVGGDDWRTKQIQFDSLLVDLITLLSLKSDFPLSSGRWTPVIYCFQ